LPAIQNQDTPGHEFRGVGSQKHGGGAELGGLAEVANVAEPRFAKRRSQNQFRLNESPVNSDNKSRDSPKISIFFQQAAIRQNIINRSEN
jgi:hypothetical protein